MNKPLHKRLLAMLLVLAMVLAVAPMVLAEEPALATADEVVVYYTNDVHTYIDGKLSYDTVAALKAETAKVAAGVALVDAGDAIQGTAYGSMDDGASIIKLMNAAGYDLATLGNHEFDYGMARAMQVIEDAAYPYLSCNFYHEKDGVRGENVLSSYKILELGGLKVAFVGITTPESFTKSTPAYFMDEEGNYIYGISGGDDGAALCADVQKAVDEAKAAGADVVIGLGHLGVDMASSPWTSKEVIAKVSGLDAFIDGHSHTTMESEKVADKDGKEVVLTQTGSYMDAIGRMSINVNTKEITTSLIKECTLSDETTKTVKDAWIKEVNDKLGVVIGKADVTFDNYDETGRLVRKMETNTGDFAADALYYLFNTQYKDLGCDVAVMNGGGVRNKAITGDISYLTCKNIHTFGNVACLQTVTGQQILDALEWGARDTTTKECGGFLQVSGLTYEIHTYLPTGCQKDDKGVWTGHEGTYRVQNVQVMNRETGKYEPLDLTKKYNLAGYNYTLRDMGDGFNMFDGAVNVVDYVMEDYMVLANFVKSFPVDETTGLPTITAENSPYGSVYGEGRITLKATPFTDVDKDRYGYDEICYMFNKGYMKGVTTTEFQPEKTLTRAEAITVLYRMAGSPSVEGLPEHPFTDTVKTAYYADALTWGYYYGVTTGVTETEFYPTTEITRAQMVTMIFRSKSLVHPVGAIPLTTTSETIPDYAAVAMQWALDNGIIKGFPDGTVRPNDLSTRRQFATVAYRFDTMEG